MKRSGCVVNVVGCEPVREKTLMLHAEKRSDMQLFFSPVLCRGILADLYILPFNESFVPISTVLPRRSFRPVIAYGEPEYMDAAFNSFCSDYLCEPWGIREFFSRVQRWKSLWSCDRDGFYFALEGRLLCILNGAEKEMDIILTQAEMRLFEVLSLRCGHFVGRRALEMLVFGSCRSGSRRIDMLVSRLRTKMDELIKYSSMSESFSFVPDSGEILSSSPGQGYCLNLKASGAIDGRFLIADFVPM